jgi:hypothetical protein
MVIRMDSDDLFQVVLTDHGPVVRLHSVPQSPSVARTRQRQLGLPGDWVLVLIVKNRNSSLALGLSLHALFKVYRSVPLDDIPFSSME